MTSLNGKKKSTPFVDIKNDLKSFLKNYFYLYKDFFALASAEFRLIIISSIAIFMASFCGILLVLISWVLFLLYLGSQLALFFVALGLNKIHIVWLLIVINSLPLIPLIYTIKKYSKNLFFISTRRQGKKIIFGENMEEADFNENN